VSSVALADIVVTLIDSLGPSWGWIGLGTWVLWQLYCPLPNHCTKLQQVRRDFTERLRVIETTQIALAEEVAGVDEGEVRTLHGEDGVTVSQLKDGTIASTYVSDGGDEDGVADD